MKLTIDLKVRDANPEKTGSIPKPTNKVNYLRKTTRKTFVFHQNLLPRLLAMSYVGPIDILALENQSPLE